MPGLYGMAILSTVIACVVGAATLRRVSRPDDRRMLFLLFCLELPMCALAFYCLRTPLMNGLGTLLGKTSAMYAWLGTTFAPLTEEPAKFWPVLLPALHRAITRENYVASAVALGLGFGVGEMWFIAAVIVNDPRYVDAPWYQFTGFLFERLQVCALHGAFTMMALQQLRSISPEEPPRRPVRGILTAMLLHWGLNFPIFLLGIMTIVPRSIVAPILSVWVLLYFLAMLGLLQEKYTNPT